MSQRGNILFLILLAVVLFAALSYAVTSSTRGGGNDASPEKAQAIASQIINYATLVENTIQRLKASGCRDTELSFQNNTFSGYTNNNTPGDGRCKLFDPVGGGISTQKWSDTELDESNEGSAFYGETVINGGAYIVNVGTPSTGELILWVPYIDMETCKAINKTMFGFAEIPIQSTGTAPWHPAYNRFNGTYANGSAMTWSTVLPNIPAANKLIPRTGCIQVSATSNATYFQNKYIFFHVLLAR